MGQDAGATPPGGAAEEGQATVPAEDDRPADPRFVELASEAAHRSARLSRFVRRFQDPDDGSTSAAHT